MSKIARPWENGSAEVLYVLSVILKLDVKVMFEFASTPPIITIWLPPMALHV